MAGTSNYGNHFKLTSRWETHVTTMRALTPKYPVRLFSSEAKSNIEM